MVVILLYEVLGAIVRLQDLAGSLEEELRSEAANEDRL